MPLMVRAFPVRSVEELAAFTEELRSKRKAQTADFYRRYGISHESWHLQDSPAGPLVICVTAIDDHVEATPRYAKSDAEFESWFKERVMALSGVDPADQPKGPSTTEVFVWADEKRRYSNLCTRVPPAA